MLTEALLDNEKVSRHKEDDFYLIRKIEVKRKMTENCSINSHVISDSIVKLLEVIEEACDNNTEIFGYKTDAVYCERPRGKGIFFEFDTKIWGLGGRK